MQQNLFVLNAVDSIANQIFLELRDRQAQLDRVRFRRNLVKLGEIMAYELSKGLQYHSVDVQTVLGVSPVKVPKYQPVLATIIRAGLPFLEGFLHLFETSDCGFVGVQRIEDGEEINATAGYTALGDIEGKELIVIDPMLATGNSVLAALDQILQKGNPSMLHLVFAIAAPEGIEQIKKSINIPHKIWVGAIDERLNHKGYIVPGLGDAGDLLFGNKI